MQVTIEKVEVAKGRGRLYLLLSRVFIKEVTPQFLKGLKEERVAEALRELGVNLDYHISRMDEEELVERLAEEYTQLFLVPGGISLCESVWLKGLLLQEPASEVMTIYRKGGFDYQEDSKLFPDQIGVELAFMGFLAEAESRAIEEGRSEEASGLAELQKEFLTNHLGRWGLEFCKTVMEYTIEPFYREMARLTYSFLESEMREMGITPKGRDEGSRP